MPDLQREKEIEAAATWNAELPPADACYLLAELKEARGKYDRLLHTHDDVTLPLLYEATEKLEAVDKWADDFPNVQVSELEHILKGGE